MLQFLRGSDVATRERRPDTSAGRKRSRARQAARLTLEALEQRLTPAGRVVAASFFDSALYEFDASTGARLGTLVAPNSSALLSGPAGLTLGPDRDLYISSQFSDAILKYDFGSATLSTFIPASVLTPIGTGIGAPAFAPAGLRFGPDGNLYVSLNGGQSSTTGAVVRFGVTNTAGVLSYGGTDTVIDAGGVVQPSGLTFGTTGDTTSLYVSSPGTGAVVKLSAATGASPTPSTFVAPGSGNLNFPAGLSWGGDGKLYVVDLGATSFQGQVLRFNANGSFNSVFVAAGTGANPGDLTFQFPSDATFDDQGHLITANLGPAYPPNLQGSINQYGAGGAFLSTLVSSGQFPSTGPGTSGISPSQIVYLPDPVLVAASFFDSALYEYNEITGAQVGNPLVAPYTSALLSGPAGLTTGPDGNLYISSQFNDAILKYDYATSSLSTFIPASVLTPIANDPVTGIGAPAFAPAGLRFGPDGRLYVSLNGGQSSTTGAVVRFAITSSSGGLSYGGSYTVIDAGGVVQPSGLTFGTAGDTTSLYVSSPGTGAVVKLSAATGASPTPSTFVAPGSGNLNFPAGLTWGGDGKLYVVDLGATSNLGQVLRFNANGSFDTVYVAAGTGANPGDLAFQFPSDATFDDQGRLIAANLGPAYPPNLLGSINQYNAGGTFNRVLVSSAQYPSTGPGTSGIAPAQLSFVQLGNTPPTITSAASATFTTGTNGSFTLTGLGVPTPTFTVSGTLPTGVGFNAGTGVISGTPAAGSGGVYTLLVTAHNGVGHDATQTFTLTVTPFRVTSFTPTQSGFRFQLNSAPVFANLNLLDLFGTTPVEAPDVVVTGPVNALHPNGVYNGTLVQDAADPTVFTWVATGDPGPGQTRAPSTQLPLGAGTYTVKLVSGASAWTSATSGVLQGGVGDTNPGTNDYDNSFTVTANPYVSVPNVVLGPGQPLSTDGSYTTTANLGADGSGAAVKVVQVPLFISAVPANADGISFDLVYNPNLLTLFSGDANGGTGLTITAAGASLGIFDALATLNPYFDTTNPNAYVAQFGFSLISPTPTSTPVAFATFAVRVPDGTYAVPGFVTNPNASGSYGQKAVLDLTNLTVTAGASNLTYRDDDGVDVNAYVGDLSGDRQILSQDASLAIQFYGVGVQNHALASYPLIDPVLISDATFDGKLLPQDATAIIQEFGNPSSTAIPNQLPTGQTATSGPDPVLFVGTTFAADGKPADLGGLTPGATVVVPVSMFVTAKEGVSVAGADVAFRFDPAVFDLKGVVAGAIGDGSLGGSPFAVDFREVAPGEVEVAGLATSGPQLKYGETETLFLVSLTVRQGAAAGATAFDLRASDQAFLTQLFDNQYRALVLVPAPTDKAGDDVDGTFTVADLKPGTVPGQGDALAAFQPLPVSVGTGKTDIQYPWSTNGLVPTAAALFGGAAADQSKAAQWEARAARSFAAPADEPAWYDGPILGAFPAVK
jgi:hypothetical protein